MEEVKFKIEKILLSLIPDIRLDSDSLVDDGMLGSLDIVTLITEIDDEFGIRIPPEEIIPETFNSVKAISALVLNLELNMLHL